jgi:Xaa-Pro aminopeptidase
MKRLRQWMNDQDLAAVLLSNPFNLTWITGYAPPIQTGPSPFEGGPALAWLRGDSLVLLASDMESATARACGVDVRDYVSYTIDEPLNGSDNQAAALRDLLGPETSLSGAVGVEYAFLPAVLSEVIREVLPHASFWAIDGEIDPLKAVKTTEEIQMIRNALRLCDLAQAEVKARLRPGISEIELWTSLKSRLENEAGGRLPVLTDLVAGLRTAEIGGLPGETCLQDGDPVIADIVPRLAGYWGDNAATHFTGEPMAELSKIYRTVRDALRRGVEAVRPGVGAADLDGMLRAAIQDAGYPIYPHHSGHGIGTSYHEEPRIVPYNTLTLQPGMVVALEPGIYVPGTGGVRLEDVVLVTDDGCELLTTHLLDS